jgi:hypothetical protein
MLYPNLLGGSNISYDGGVYGVVSIGLIFGLYLLCDWLGDCGGV